MKGWKGGYLTLSLTLTVGILLSLIFTLVWGVRIQTIRMETEGVMDIGLHSVFGEYNRQLLEQYDLFYLDTTYGQKEPSLDRVEEHLQYYMNENFRKEGTGLGYRNLTELHCDNVLLEAYVRASDQEGDSVKRQMINYSKRKKGIALLEDMAKNLSLIEEASEKSREVNQQWDQAHKEINELLEEKRRELAEENPDEEPSVSIDNPADSVQETRGRGILEKALPEGKRVSAVRIHPENYFSHRIPLVGNGWLKRKEGLLDQAADRFFLLEYLWEKCGCYGSQLDKGVLAYQLEYLLKGEGEDDENLRKVLEDILTIRQGINMIYLFSSDQKQMQAGSIATVIAGVLSMPQLVEPVKLTILCAWGYAESVKDIHILLAGDPVPLQKTDKNWQTPLLHLVNYTAHLGEYQKEENGMVYADYLKLFFYLQEEKQILERFMDICEMDIRITPGNRYFRMDGCLEAIRAKANVTSGYGYSCDITRSFYY